MKRDQMKKGARVKYLDGFYGSGPSNPLWGKGGKFVMGTITRIDGHHIQVDWDNGASNDYLYEHLELAEDVGICEDIW
jgi:hypothetical protein